MSAGHPLRNIAAAYFAALGTSALAWWAGLLLSPPFRALFPPADALMAFALPDLTLYAGGSLASAYGIWKQREWAPGVLLLHVGAGMYAGLYCLAYPLLNGGQGWLGAMLMFPSVLLSPALAWMIYGPTHARPGSAGGYVVKTILQIVIFWGLFLFVLPVSIRGAEAALGAPTFTPRPTIAIALFVAGGTLGLWSAWVIATIGRGTPMPTDPTHALVIRGPYRTIRNPMAVAGVVQGVAVGVHAGSALVVVYALAGGVVWQVLIRPWEEADLERKFGDEYRSYRSRVRCWYIWTVGDT